MSQIQKHTTAFAAIGWILIVAAAFPLLKGFAVYSKDLSGETQRTRLALARLHDASVARFGPQEDYDPSPYEEGQGLVPCLIGGAMVILGSLLVLGSSVFRCSECGGKVAMRNAKICPSCRTSFDAVGS